MVENSRHLDQDVIVAGPSKPKSSRIEGSLLESPRASLKEEITSEIKNLLFESQKEMLKLLKPETRENVMENTEEETENETRSFNTRKKSVRINFTQNDDPCSSGNMVTTNRLHQPTTKTKNKVSKPTSVNRVSYGSQNTF